MFQCFGGNIGDPCTVQGDCTQGLVCCAADAGHNQNTCQASQMDCAM
jgi:hypothetical protein